MTATRQSKRIPQATRDKMRQCTSDENNMGAIIRDKVPHYGHSFIRNIAYEYNKNDKSQYKLTDEAKLGIVQWASVPIPVESMAKLTDNKHKPKDDESGYFAFVFYDNSERFHVTDAVKLMADDDEYRQHLSNIPTNIIAYLPRVYEHYKLSLASLSAIIDQGIDQERRKMGAVAVQQCLFRMGQKINTRLVFNNKFKGLASNRAPLDLNHFENGGQDAIEEIFGIKGTRSGTKITFMPFDGDILNKCVGLEVMTKWDPELGSIFVDPDRLVYDTQSQNITLFYAFATGKQQNCARSFPKVKGAKKRRKRKRQSKSKKKNWTVSKAKRRKG